MLIAMSRAVAAVIGVTGSCRLRVPPVAVTGITADLRALPAVTRPTLLPICTGLRALLAAGLATLLPAGVA
jgi:hypothetical protein